MNDIEPKIGQIWQGENSSTYEIINVDGGDFSFRRIGDPTPWIYVGSIPSHWKVIGYKACIDTLYVGDTIKCLRLTGPDVGKAEEIAYFDCEGANLVDGTIISLERLLDWEKVTEVQPVTAEPSRSEQIHAKLVELEEKRRQSKPSVGWDPEGWIW